MRDSKNPDHTIDWDKFEGYGETANEVNLIND
jgi:hypothetical protein